MSAGLTGVEVEGYNLTNCFSRGLADVYVEVGR